MFKSIYLMAIFSILYTKVSFGNWTPPEPVALTPTNDFGVTLTLDDSDRVWAAWYNELEEYKAVALVSYFNGNSWVDPMQPGGTFSYYEYFRDRLRPGIAKDDSNYIWLSWAPYMEAVKQEFGVWTSYYNGSTWSTPLEINDYGEGRVPLEFNKSTNKLVLAFEIGRYQNMTNFTSLCLTSIDGDTWSIPCCIAQGWSDWVSGSWETFGKASLASISFLIWIAFEDWGKRVYPQDPDSFSFFHDINVGYYNLQNGSFTVDWSHNGEECDIAGDRDDNIWVVFVDSSYIYSCYRDTLGNWSTPSLIDDGCSPSITVNQYGQIWVTYSHSDDIYVAYWKGGEWSSPEAITLDAIKDSRPQIIGDTSGKMWVLWERDSNIYYSTSYQGIEESHLLSTHSIPILSLHSTPTSSIIHISYLIPEAEKVEFGIYNLGGKKVKMLVSGSFDAGEKKITGDVRDIPQGIYFLRLKFNDIYITKKFLVLR